MVIVGNNVYVNYDFTELLQKERVPSLSFYILRICVSFIPPAIPSGMSDIEVVNILARYLVHIDSGTLPLVFIQIFHSFY